MLGQVITIASGKGGTGKTSTAANIAVALCAYGEKVLLIDADIGLRCLDIVLGMSSYVLFSYGDVICGRATLKQAAVTHPIVKNLYLLTAPASFDEKEAFSQMRIDKVKLSDAKAFLIKLQKDGRGYRTIHSVRGVIRPAFEMALQDDLIRKNPFQFELATVVVNDSVTREAITRKQERELLKFIKEDAHFSRYYDAIYILFHTGLRISEFCGLTVSEIEFDEMRIKVDHQLQRTSQMKYVIEEPKTESGTRYVPMTEEVAACFRRIIASREAPKVEPMVDGYIRFLCLDKNDMPKVALHWEKYLEHIVEKYNKIYRIQMPKVTPHVCRHTFCSNMAKSGINPKTLQYIMGHSDISVTLNVYTHVNFDDAKAEVLRVANG